MPRLIASSCLHIINHSHRREPLVRSRAEGKHDHTPRPLRSGCATIVHTHIISVPRKPNHPSRPLPPRLLPSPSLPATFPTSFWKESAVLMDFFLAPHPLSPPQSLRHHPPQTPLQESLSHAWSSLDTIPHPAGPVQGPELPLRPSFSISCASGTFQVLRIHSLPMPPAC